MSSSIQKRSVQLKISHRFVGWLTVMRVPLIAVVALCFLGTEIQNSCFVEARLATAENRTQSFLLELAATKTQRGFGLMFRKELDENGGMLFNYPTPRKVKMWMKNTLIPLDVLFIDEYCQVETVVKGAKVESESLISSIGPIQYVIELRSQEKRVGDIKPGDHLTLRSLRGQRAARVELTGRLPVCWDLGTYEQKSKST